MDVERLGVAILAPSPGAADASARSVSVLDGHGAAHRTWSRARLRAMVQIQAAAEPRSASKRPAARQMRTNTSWATSSAVAASPTTRWPR